MKNEGNYFSLKNNAKNQAISLIKSIYKMFISTDASMIEINPLILTKEEKIICLNSESLLQKKSINCIKSSI